MTSCANYDHIEAVCLFKYPVELLMRSGKIICGKALDTQINREHEECIKVQAQDGEILVALNSIHKLRVLVENPHCKEILFG